MELQGDQVLHKLEESTKNAFDHQLHTLRSILQHQSHVLYLRRHLSGFQAPIDAATFRRRVPLSSYDDYVDHINQMADGLLDPHNTILSVDPFVCFFYSSGASTMKPKLIPYFDSAPDRAASHSAFQSIGAIHQRLVPPRPDVTKVLWFLYADNFTTTRGGFMVMALSTFEIQRISKESWSHFCSSPREVVFGRNVDHQMYCHLLCALRHFDSIDGVRAAYAAGLVKAFSMLETKWEQICDDLENGFPNSEITDAAMRESVVELLGGPREDLSTRIRSICEENNWGGIVLKLWPNVRYIKCVTTGSMKQYYSKLKYYAGDVMVLNGDYLTSECCVGINLDIKQPPELTTYVILPTAAYFEFLPFDFNQSSTVVGDETVDFTGVELGRTYEVVVTTYRGLYRYRLGDIVRVVGFHNTCPKIEFVMRAPNTADAVITEKDLMSAMESFQLEMMDVMEAEILEFASFLDSESSPKQLKIFVEVKEGPTVVREWKSQESVEALRRCCGCLEKSLGNIYTAGRNWGEIGPLLVCIVRHGTFDKIMEVAIKNGAAASQYKPPKIIRNSEIVGLMEASVDVSVCSSFVNMD